MSAKGKKDRAKNKIIVIYISKPKRKNSDYKDTKYKSKSKDKAYINAAIWTTLLLIIIITLVFKEFNLLFGIVKRNWDDLEPLLAIIGGIYKIISLFVDVLSGRKSN